MFNLTKNPPTDLCPAYTALPGEEMKTSFPIQIKSARSKSKPSDPDQNRQILIRKRQLASVDPHPT